jgi:DNA-binding CsgD family transcriptional regulator
MLESLGIEPRAELVYRALLGRPGTASASLAETLGRPVAGVEEDLAALVGAGLALRAADETYVVAPPTVALGALITERRDGLRLAEQALASLAEEHRAATAGRSISELIEVVTGVDAIRHRYQQVQQAATSELRMFVTAPFVAVPPGQNTAEAATAHRGIRIRAILERAVFDEPSATHETIDSLRRGLELRVVDRLPLKLVLADADLALVPLLVDPADAEAEPGAVMLQRSGLLAALDVLFESVWNQAYPLELAHLDAGFERAARGSDDGLTPLDRQILSLMLAGLTDQAVATQLDLSLRTVQRRLRYLQDLSGAKSRMQLGWHAARHDWA